MITDGKKWHYLAMKSLSALLRGITSNHDGDFYCLNCFHTYSTKNKPIKHEMVCNDHGYCYVEKTLKVLFMIYADLACLLEKCIHVKINLKNLIQRKKTKHTSSGYTLFTNCPFDATKNKL